MKPFAFADSFYVVDALRLRVLRQDPYFFCLPLETHLTPTPLAAQESSLETAHAGASSLDLAVGVRLIFRDFLHLMAMEPDDREAPLPCFLHCDVTFTSLLSLRR